LRMMRISGGLVSAELVGRTALVCPGPAGPNLEAERSGLIS
jgi:hypothetical protein